MPSLSKKLQSLLIIVPNSSWALELQYYHIIKFLEELSNSHIYFQIFPLSSVAMLDTSAPSKFSFLAGHPSDPTHVWNST